MQKSQEVYLSCLAIKPVLTTMLYCQLVLCWFWKLNSILHIHCVVYKVLWDSQRYSFQVCFFFFFFSWRLITLQYCSGFCHTLTWISHGYTCIPHPDPPSHLPLQPIKYVFLHIVQLLWWFSSILWIIKFWNNIALHA